MRKLHDIKSELLTKQILSSNELVNVKGGNGSDDNGSSNAADDDKRRARPGGGTSTL
jgi:hypothetical protein